MQHWHQDSSADPQIRIWSSSQTVALRGQTSQQVWRLLLPDSNAYYHK